MPALSLESAKSAQSAVPAFAPATDTFRLRGRDATGTILVERVAGRSALTRCRATAPLKLIAPRQTRDPVTVYTSTYGGGLVAGDDVSLDVTVGPGAALTLRTQAPTKVFHRHAGRNASHLMRATVADGATLAVLPDPVTCYADADYVQDQRFELQGDASLVLLDAFTAGRAARGERWVFHRYRSRNVVTLDGREIVYDALSLDSAHGPLTGPLTVGRFTVYMNLLLVGPAAAPIVASLLGYIEATPLDRADPITLSFSPTPFGGQLRLATESPEAATTFLQNHLNSLTLLQSTTPPLASC